MSLLTARGIIPVLLVLCSCCQYCNGHTALNVSEHCAPINRAFLRSSLSGRTLVVRDIHLGIGLGHVLEYRGQAYLAGLASNRTVVFDHCEEHGQAKWTDKHSPEAGGEGLHCEEKHLAVTFEARRLGRVPADVAESYSPVYGPTLSELRSGGAVFPPPSAPVVMGDEEGEVEHFRELLYGPEPVVVVEKPLRGNLDEMLSDSAGVVAALGLQEGYLREVQAVPPHAVKDPARVWPHIWQSMNCCALQAGHWSPNHRLDRRVTEYLRRYHLAAPPAVVMHIRTFDVDEEECRFEGPIDSWDQLDRVMAECSAPEEEGGFGRAAAMRGQTFSSMLRALGEVTGGRPVHVATDSKHAYEFLASGKAGAHVAVSGEPFIYPTKAFYYTFGDVLDMHLMAQAQVIVAPLISSFSAIAQCLSHREEPPRVLTSLEEILALDREAIQAAYQTASIEADPETEGAHLAGGDSGSGSAGHSSAGGVP